MGLAIPNPSAAGRPGALQFEATCKCNFANNYPYAIGPRLGLAYQIDSKTVLRAGFGVVYNATLLPAGSSANSAATGGLAAQLRPDHRPVQGWPAVRGPAEVALV